MCGAAVNARGAPQQKGTISPPQLYSRAQVSSRVPSQSLKAVAQPAATPSCSALPKSSVRFSPVRKPATRESPEPTVLRTVPQQALARYSSPPSVSRKAPRLPMDTITFRAPSTWS